MLAYVDAHGGGTIGVESQSRPRTAIIESDAEVAGLGGFSGRESSVWVAWLAQRVRSGQLRWVLGESNTGGEAAASSPLAGLNLFGGPGARSLARGALARRPSGRHAQGSRRALDAAAKACVKVAVSTGRGHALRLQGRAAQLEALARESGR